MATKKTAKASASKPSGPTTKKSTKPSVAKLKTTKTSKTNKPITTKASSSKKTSTAHKPSGLGRTIAIIAGIIAGVALIIIGIIALVNGINKNGHTNMTVETSSGEKIETQYLGFNDYKFQLKIPKSFHALTEAEISQKYSNNTPNVVYADQDNQVNITISITDTDLENDQIEVYLKTMETGLGLSGAKILDSKLIKQGNHNIGTLQYTTDSTEGKYYNYMALFSQDGKLNMVTFNTKDMERETWQPVADFIIKSLDFIK